MSDRERFLQQSSPEMEAAFPIEEYRRRLDRLRTAMSGAELDVVFLSAPESMCWLSGFAAEWYQGQSPTGFHPASGLAVHAGHDRWIHFDAEDEWILAKCTSSELFQAALERCGATVVDATRMVRAVRRHKSPAELAHVRTAQRIADIGMRAAIEKMQPGMTELEVYAEVVYAMARAGGENPGITMPVASGAKGACVHALASRRVIMPGDIVNVDVSGVYNRYHANMARCFSIGEDYCRSGRRRLRPRRRHELRGELLPPRGGRPGHVHQHDDLRPRGGSVPAQHPRRADRDLVSVRPAAILMMRADRCA